MTKCRRGEYFVVYYLSLVAIVVTIGEDGAMVAIAVLETVVAIAMMSVTVLESVAVSVVKTVVSIAVAKTVSVSVETIETIVVA